MRSICITTVPRGRSIRHYRVNYLLDQINCVLQVHAEVNESPFNALALVLLLFQHEHVVIKELLELLVGEIDAQLLETIVLCLCFGPTEHHHREKEEQQIGCAMVRRMIRMRFGYNIKMEYAKYTVHYEIYNRWWWWWFIVLNC